MTIYITYLEKYYLEKLDIKEIEQVISEIKNESNADLVSKIRNEPDKNKRLALKSKLPCFFPTLQLYDENKLSDTSTPNGIIQFDIDLDDNPNLDFVDLKTKLSTIPETIYLFSSPSGGLKLGILTDFRKQDGEELDSLKNRHGQAFDKISEYVKKYVECEFCSCTRTLKHLCYISSDKDIYFNDHCKIYEIDGQCIYNKIKYDFSNNISITGSNVKNLLSYIPTYLRYAERYRINLSVLNTLGKEGINILLNHWLVENPDKLKKDITSQYKYKNNQINYGFLINQAKKNGYKPEPIKTVNQRRPKNIDFVFPPLLTQEEAGQEIKRIVESFFKSKTSIFMNVSTGFGKTQLVLENLRFIDPYKKVLFLVKNHKLANELKERFLAIDLEAETFRDKLKMRSRINHIKGRAYDVGNGNTMCENSIAFESYKNAGIPFPPSQCINDCFLVDTCQYIEQFNDLANIRIMTHNEYINVESYWFSGSESTDNGATHKRVKKWKPDYLIIDEDWMTIETVRESGKTNYNSVSKILHDCKNGESIENAIKKNAYEILNDHTRSTKSSYPVKFINRNQYISEYKKQNNERHSEIFNLLYQYITENFNDEVVKNLKFYKDKSERNKDYLILSIVEKPQERYKNIPTLYLDATANESVTKEILGDIPFYSLKVKTNEKSNVYQIEDANYTKSKLENESDRNYLIEKIKEMIKPYKSVGLITYQNITGFKYDENIEDSQDFYKWISDQLGISNYGYFGNLRGLDCFKNVDCLLVVGRYMIPTSLTKDKALAVYGLYEDIEQESVSKPIRMKDGTAKSIENKCYIDSRMEDIHNHFSTSETIQAIGRARLIYSDKPKDVFLFSKESLGSDIEITDFFRIEKPKYYDAISKLREIGFCEDKKKFLNDLGLSNNAIDRDRETIEKEFLEDGFKKITLTFKTEQRKKIQKTIFYLSESGIQEYLKTVPLAMIH